jgi:RNA polymerase sigma factor (sigma-70 family)
VNKAELRSAPGNCSATADVIWRALKGLQSLCNRVGTEDEGVIGLARRGWNNIAAQQVHRRRDASMDAQSARERTIEAYQLHAGVLLAYSHRLTRDDALAQDALQETFLRYFLALAQGEDIRNVRAWLHRVAHNYVCETLRSARIRTAVSLEDAGEERLRDERSMPDADRAADWINAARQLLAPREWQCVQLRAEGFDYTEIATELAIRPGTVGSLLHRASEKLRIRLRKKEGSA